MGWRVIDDCQLGRVVTHSGGYPGYGSNVALLPDKNLGIFVFSNRTYGPTGAAMTAALLELQKSLDLAPRTIPVSAGLAAIYDAAKAVWASGSITAAPIGNNVLLDHDAAAWAAMIAEAKAAVGDCATDAPIRPVSAMEGKFSWTCSQGQDRRPGPAHAAEADRNSGAELHPGQALTAYFAPKPDSIVLTVRNRIRTSSQGEKYLM